MNKKNKNFAIILGALFLMATTLTLSTDGLEGEDLSMENIVALSQANAAETEGGTVVCTAPWDVTCAVVVYSDGTSDTYDGTKQ